MLRWAEMARGSKVQFVAFVFVTVGSMAVIVVGTLVASPGNGAAPPTGAASPWGASGTPPPSP